MNITPNYYLRNFNYLPKNFKEQEPKPAENLNFTSAVTKHAVKESQKLMKFAPVILLPVITTKSKENKATAEAKIPTKEEFVRSIDAYRKQSPNNETADVISSLEAMDFIDLYDRDPAKAVELFKFRQEIAKMKYDNGLPVCKGTSDAFELAKIKQNFPKAFKVMLNMKDKLGNPRFVARDCIQAVNGEHIELFENHPDLLIKYAKLNNDNGHPRFDHYEIAKLIELNDSFPSEEIDNAIKMRRNDGSYVFYKAPYAEHMYFIKEQSKEFKELVNLQIPGSRNQTTYLPFDDIGTELMYKYIRHPEGIKGLLCIPHASGAGQRFSCYDIQKANPTVLEYFKKCPKSFMAIADMRQSDNNIWYRFDLGAIDDIVCYFGKINESNDYNCSEIDSEAMNYLGIVSNIRPVNRYTLSPMDIIESYDAYKKYPKETLEILENYVIYNRVKHQYQSVQPTVGDVELYINDRATFDVKYKRSE